MSNLFTAYGKAAMAAAGVENSLILLIALVRSEGLSDEYFTKEYKN
jgi:hypothetical protein